MLQISQLRLPLDYDEAILKGTVLRELRARAQDIVTIKMKQRAIDARRGNVEFSCQVLVEVLNEGVMLQRLAGNHRIKLAEPTEYTELDKTKVNMAPVPPEKRPVIIGTGPCGLLAGLILARHGRNPLILERGKPAGDRARDVMAFWKRGGDFNPESNVQFGEGGAGTFSDGKLYTQIRDRENRIPWLLKELVKAGAPEDILYKSRPHIGTDRLIKVVRNMREEIVRMGGEVRFGAHVTDAVIENGKMTKVILANGEEILGSPFIFAVGHSARDTFEMLHRIGVPMEAKGFSVGVRIEHPQSLIDRSQYGKWGGHPRLGAAPYKFVAHCDTGRAAYSFCMCPGGLVVAASSEPGMVVTNGMSTYARAESNANAGFMVDIPATDFADQGVLGGMAFQRALEKQAYELGGGGFKAPAQRLGDFMKKQPSSGPGRVQPSYQPGVTWTDLATLLPDIVTTTLREAVRRVDDMIPGFGLDDAVMTGVETRSSCPLRILRDPDSLLCAGIENFYPAGEGAGYAGGIVSAACDGMRVAEKILNG
ncbi:MAG: hypothetical protein JNJ83_23450 [Verrucomicrobiaceae bacterium]|nr:hypothetical protein [Verrucomicrobiaceae bacterium]